MCGVHATQEERPLPSLDFGGKLCPGCAAAVAPTSREVKGDQQAAGLHSLYRALVSDTCVLEGRTIGDKIITKIIILRSSLSSSLFLCLCGRCVFLCGRCVC